MLYNIIIYDNILYYYDTCVVVVEFYALQYPYTDITRNVFGTALRSTVRILLRTKCCIYFYLRRLVFWGPHGRNLKVAQKRTAVLITRRTWG